MAFALFPAAASPEAFHALTDADVGGANSETPSATELLATVPTATAGDLVQYTTPENAVIDYTIYDNGVGGLAIKRDDDELPIYAILPDFNNFDTGAEVRVGSVWPRTIYRNLGNIFDEQGVEGGDGGGGTADGNGLIREAGYVAGANELVAVDNSLWKHPAGATVPTPATAANMATAGFVDSLTAAAGTTDFLADDFVATVGQQNYVLSATPTDQQSLNVDVDGAPDLVLGTSFTIAGNTVSLSAAAAANIIAGDNVRITYV